MARYRATLETSRTREEVFAYVSDFSRAREWDPGVVAAERLTEAPIGEGSEFRLTAEFLGRRSVLTYRITEYNPPNAVTFRGENAKVTSIDRITFDEVDGLTRLSYDADLRLKGSLRIADPLLGFAFARVGDRALAGLRDRLAPGPIEALSLLSGRGVDGRVYELPHDLPDPYNLLLVAFRREQQELVEGWLSWVTAIQRDHPQVGVYELPVISSIYGPARRFIDGGTVCAFPDSAARARTITVHTGIPRVLENLGLQDTSTLAVALVGRGGRILARELGGVDQNKAERLRVALRSELDEDGETVRPSVAPVGAT